MRFAVGKILVPIGGGAHLAATHGNDRALLAALIGAGTFPYVCHGHTHAPRDERIGTTRVVNPGALCHADRTTVALLDTAADTVEFIEIR